MIREGWETIGYCLVLVLCALMFFFIGVNAQPSGPSQIEFHKGKLDELIAGANSAGHCGGYVIIDTDDREVLVASCDR